MLLLAAEQNWLDVAKNVSDAFTTDVSYSKERVPKVEIRFQVEQIFCFC